MNIFTEIKDFGIEIFLFPPDGIKLLKLEAKELHKKLKKQGVTFAQCKELIAQEYGFKSLRDFYNLILNHYQLGKNNSDFYFNKKLEKKDNFLLGYDIDIGHFKWIKRKVNNYVILGSDIYKNYDVFLAKQAIENNEFLFFLNNVENTNTIDILKDTAIISGREKDIKIIRNGKNDKKIYNDFQTENITYLFLALINDESIQLNINFYNYYQMFFSILKYKCTLNKTPLSLEFIKENLTLERHIELLNDLPIDLFNLLYTYISNLKGYNAFNMINEQTLNEHQFFIKDLNLNVNTLINSGFFSNNENGFKIDEIFSSNGIYILNSSPSNEIFNQFILSLAAKNSFISKNKTNLNDKPINFFIREFLAVPFWCFGGINLVISYSSLSDIKNNSFMKNIISDSNTIKIMSSNEKDSLIIDLLNQCKDSVSEPNSVVMPLSTSIEDIKPSYYNYIWVKSKAELARITFKQLESVKVL